MSGDDKHITRRDLNLIVENLSLKISARMDTKFDEFTEAIHQANVNRRNNTVEEMTGFPWEDRAKVKAAVQYAHQASVGASETKSQVKKAIIGYTIPFGIGGAITWLITHFNKAGP